MRIVVVICLWGREEIARLTLDNLRWRKDCVASSGVQIEVLACGSEGAKSQAVAREHGANYMEFANRPLGAKFNAALVGAQSYNPDAVMVLGSDNLVNADIFTAWAAGVEQGKEYMGFTDGYMFDVSSRELIHWHGYRQRTTFTYFNRKGEPLGSGRCFSRALLDRAEWRLWDSRKEKALDWSTTQRLRHLKPISMVGRMEDFGIRHIGLKTKENISSFKELLKNSSNNITRLCPETLDEWFGAEGKRRILGLRDDSTIQDFRETADLSREDGHNALRRKLIVELQDKAVCPRCLALIPREKVILLGVVFREGEKFVCSQCATREQEAFRAKRSGEIPQPRETVQRVPFSDTEGGADDAVSGGGEAEGEVEGAEDGLEICAFDFPEDAVAGDDLDEA